ncbi:MAG: YgjV family protein [Clostridia bacterium]|nr:YgjV family protein [Clostridia bacterium]
MMACLTFIMGIIQKNGAKYRFWTILNCVLWALYDIFSGAYNGLIAHLTVLIFTVTGMIINDRKAKKEVLI